MLLNHTDELKQVNFAADRKPAMKQLTQPLTLVAIQFAAFMTLPAGPNLLVTAICTAFLARFFWRRWSTG
jgi:hypothetical protein